MRRTTLSLMWASLWMAGCATPSNPDAVAMSVPDLPDQWRADAPVAMGTEAESVTTDWWRHFGSDELNRLVEQAEASSLDIAAATARVRQAQAQARIVGASLLPEVALSAEASRQSRLGGRANDSTRTAVTGNNLSLGLTASYELDFWGRQAQLREGALATTRASVFDRDTVRLSVVSAVVSSWLQAVAWRDRIGIAEQNLQDAERLLRLVESRSRAGAALPLELAQQRGLVAAQQRALAALRQQARDAETRIGVLLGQAGLNVPLQGAGIEQLRPPLVGPGFPSRLLVRRPDIARSEAQLARANADLAVARAAMLPSVTLVAGISAQGDRLGSLFDNPLSSLAAGFVAPIFNAGRLSGGRDLAQAQREELLAAYRSAILAAFADVSTALNAVAGLDAQAAAQAEELAQAQHALALAKSRYRAGADTLLTMLDAQRTLYAAQDQALSLRHDRLQASVALYRALGGGWQAPAESPG